MQVLEDRVVRLKSQIEQFKGLRLYNVTKQRLARVSDELEDCVAILAQIIGDAHVDDSVSTINHSQYSPEAISEFSNSDDDDLSDLLYSSDTERDSHPNSSNYSSKFIVGTYSARLQQCVDSVSAVTNIVEVNQFMQLLNDWYQARFTPREGIRNPRFYFKSSSIHDWIDLMMLAAGSSMHEHRFEVFVSDMYAWIATLNTSDDSTWALPYSVLQFKQQNYGAVTLEAIMLEKLIKPSLYDESFYKHYVDSIECMYTETTGVTSNMLELNTILNKCFSSRSISPFAEKL